VNIYNDNDPKVCAWASELVKAGHVAPGTVLCKSIKEVQADELRQANQVHLFAGILGWPLALRLAGWPDDRPVWTGSCPCQPFSAAGKRKGTADERHLWPDMLRLIAECKPATVFGEQVASRDGREWLAGVRADMEALGYAFGAADLCAASVGAPHIRQRLFWVADASNVAAQRRSIARIQPVASRQVASDTREREWSGVDAASGSPVGGVGIAASDRPQRQQQAWAASRAVERTCVAGGMGNAESVGCERPSHTEEHGSVEIKWAHADPVARAGPWSDYRLVYCIDEKTRRIEPSISPLVDGIPARVVRLRGYGNAIVPALAAAFVRAFMETEAA